MGKRARNSSGLTLREWVAAAGWGEVRELAEHPYIEPLIAGWHNDEDPAEWRATAPKRVEDKS